MNTIYAQAIWRNGKYDGYWLVNQYGDCVGLDGELAYHPCIYDVPIEKSNFPEYPEKKEL